MRHRRTKLEMAKLREAIFNFAESMNPVSVRQIFYHLTTKDLVDKTETAYKQVVMLSGKMREDYELPFRWIADNTRWMRKPDSHDNLVDALEITRDTYRKNLWLTQDANVEIWLEKEALSGVVYPVTSEWDVPLMVTRGYPSKSFLYSAAEAMNTEKENYIYMLSDFDPSGVDLSRSTHESLTRYADDCEIIFERIAVTETQINDWDLPSRPTKKTDRRAKGFNSESVELDAILPNDLRGLVGDSITRHINRNSYAKLCEVETAERQSLSEFMSSYNTL